MYGSDLRIGLLVPSSNTTIEMEWHRMVPEGVSTHATRLFQAETNDPAKKIETVLKMHERMDDATRELMSVEPGVIAYGCTAGSFLKGAADDQAMCARLTDLAGVPFLSTASAVTKAIRHLGVWRIALATPYLDTVNEHEKQYLQAGAGVEVVSMKGLNIVGNLPKGRLGPEVAAALAREVDHPEAEAIFISCTNFRTLEALAPLEAELGKPVFSSNQATLWAALRAAHYCTPLVGYGSLLEVV